MKGEDMKSRGRKRERPEEESFPDPDTETGTDEETGKEIPIPRCPEGRACCVSCQAYRDGRCAALEDVNFGDSGCPFYLERERARAERISAMERLEESGRTDLIRKYYKNRDRFERILGSELVGVRYDFDDEGCVYVDRGERSTDERRNGDGKDRAAADGAGKQVPEEGGDPGVPD